MIRRETQVAGIVTSVYRVEAIPGQIGVSIKSLLDGIRREHPGRQVLVLGTDHSVVEQGDYYLVSLLLTVELFDE